MTNPNTIAMPLVIQNSSFPIVGRRRSIASDCVDTSEQPTTCAFEPAMECVNGLPPPAICSDQAGSTRNGTGSGSHATGHQAVARQTNQPENVSTNEIIAIITIPKALTETDIRPALQECARSGKCFPNHFHPASRAGAVVVMKDRNPLMKHAPCGAERDAHSFNSHQSDCSSVH